MVSGERGSEGKKEKGSQLGVWKAGGRRKGKEITYIYHNIEW